MEFEYTAVRGGDCSEAIAFIARLTVIRYKATFFKGRSLLATGLSQVQRTLCASAEGTQLEV